MMTTNAGWIGWLAPVGAAVTIGALVVGAQRWARAGARAALVLGGWCAAVAVLAAVGAFRPAPGGRFQPVGVAVLAAILAGVALARWRPSAVRFVTALPQPWLIGVQTVRVLGVVFLLLNARALLPTVFAQRAGWGDVAVGAAAPLVALAARRGGGRALVVAWNALGILDLAVAVGTGVATGLGLVAADHPMTLMTELPMSLIPTFLVPLFGLLHLRSLGAPGRARDAAHPALRPTSD